MEIPDLSGVEVAARAEFDPKYVARETAISNARRIIRNSGKAIRAAHRGEWEVAAGLLEDARALLDEATIAMADHPDINVRILDDAAKEYAEGRLFRALALGEEVPGARELGTRMAPYLNGLGETVGELRRRMLDRLRGEEYAEAERLLGAMDEVVNLLATLDYPDGMTGGLRRTTDVARALTERSRSDLTSALVAERLRRDLAAWRDRPS